MRLLSEVFKTGRVDGWMLLRSGEFQSQSVAAKSSVPQEDEALGGDAQMGIGGRSEHWRWGGQTGKEGRGCALKVNRRILNSMHYLTWSHWSCWGTGVMPFNYVYEEFQLSIWVCYWDFEDITCKTCYKLRTDEGLGTLGGLGPQVGTTALTHRRTAELQKELTVCQIWRFLNVLVMVLMPLR